MCIVSAEGEDRESRHRAILSIVRRRPVRLQEELVRELARRGFEVTQSSVSRDLRELGVAKLRGRYLAPNAQGSEEEPIAEVAHFLRAVKAAGPHLTVVHTAIGAAQAV